MPQSEYVTVSQSAKLLHESRWTTLRRIKLQTLPAIKTGDNTSAYLIRRADVDRIIADQLAKYAPSEAAS